MILDVNILDPKGRGKPRASGDDPDGPHVDAPEGV